MTFDGNGAERMGPLEKIARLRVERGYVDMLGSEEWLYPNLFIKNQITGLIALSGGGKTALMFNFVSPVILREYPRMRVTYFDLDSPASDHKRMMEIAEGYGDRFEWINPLTHGQDEGMVMALLNEVIKTGCSMEDRFLVFDTVKKFVDLMAKNGVKQFFKMLRKLTALGATVGFLGHANKYRAQGLLVPEGVGDVKNDSDALIILERIMAPDGQYISTVVDPDKNAKVRGLYMPISFHLGRGTRTVTAVEGYIQPPDFTGEGGRKKLSDDDVLAMLRDYLLTCEGHVKQADLIKHFKGAVGHNRLHNVLKACAVHEDDANAPGQIFYSVGTKNQKNYSVTS